MRQPFLQIFGADAAVFLKIKLVHQHAFAVFGQHGRAAEAVFLLEGCPGGFVLMQAFYLGMFAFFPALLVSFGGYFLTEWLANIPIAMNVGRVVLVFCLTLGMCIASGLLALRKLFQAEPASLF